MSSREEYLNEVCREVRFRAARRYVRQELAAHIDDKKAQLEASGAADAEAEAVQAMGSAVQTGQALNAIHRPRVEWGIIACVLLLTIAGAAALFVGTTYGIRSDERVSIFWSNLSWRLMIRCLVVMAVLIFVNYTWIRKLRHICFGAALAYIAAYIIMYIIHGVNFTLGEYGWLGQSAVIIVPGLLFMAGMAGILQRRSRWSMWDTALVLSMCAISVLATSILSSVYALVLFAVYLAMTAVALSQSPLGRAQRLWRFAAVLAVLAAVLIAGQSLQPQYLTFGDDWGDMAQVRRMLANAPFVDISPVNRSGSLTASTTGYILTAAISAYGWLFGIGVIAVFAVMLTLMVFRSFKTPHFFGRLLSFGISAYFGIRFVLFVLANLGLIGGISINLPFISHGLFNFLTDCALTGVFLSVWRRSSFMPRDAVPAAAVSQMNDAFPAPPIQ